jgi:succinate dehydrogenase/fumarate reductase flavoprotein subunit
MTGVVEKPLTVIVVGAGYAGIGAARKLLDEGGKNIKVPNLSSYNMPHKTRASVRGIGIAPMPPSFVTFTCARVDR